MKPRYLIPATATALMLMFAGIQLASSSPDARRRSIEPRLAVQATVDVEPARLGGLSYDAQAPAAPVALTQTFSVGDPKISRQKGAIWLADHQNKDGGWGAGSWGQDITHATSDVATTSLVVLALIRDADGSSKHKAAIEAGVRFVTKTSAESPLKGAQLNGPQGTQPQRKLGQFVDTHFAAMMLGEVADTMPKQLNVEVHRAWDKVLSKVMAAQASDGSFDANGWAPVLSSSMAAQSLYKAWEAGKDVDLKVIERSEAYQAGLVDADSGAFDTGKGAGVNLYAAASSLRGNTQAAKRAGGEGKARATAAAEATARVVRADTGALISGFGSIGGEEMLSYMMISDSIAEAGAKDWKDWEPKIGGYLIGIQNADGSWSGHHCITSTTFVTAAAVMTLASGDHVARVTSASTEG